MNAKKKNTLNRSIFTFSQKHFIWMFCMKFLYERSHFYISFYFMYMYVFTHCNKYFMIHDSYSQKSWFITLMEPRKYIKHLFTFSPIKENSVNDFYTRIWKQKQVGELLAMLTKEGVVFPFIPKEDINVHHSFYSNISFSWREIYKIETNA